MAMTGCGDDDGGSANGNGAGEAGSGTEQPSAGENSGGTGSVVAPTAGEGGVPQTAGGAGGVPPIVVEAGAGGMPANEGGAPAAGAGGAGDAGGAGGADGAGGSGGSADACAVHSAYGNLGTLSGVATSYTSGASWEGELAVEVPNRGTILIELVEGYPPFVNGVTTLTNHVLAGPDLNYGTCGLCLRVDESSASSTGRNYFVTGGTITISEVEDGVTGTATDLTFEEVTIDQNFVSTPVPGGCETAIDSMAFDDAFGAGGAGGAGG